MLVDQSYLTLCDPMDWYLPDSCVRGIVQARVLEWGAITFCKHTYVHFTNPTFCVFLSPSIIYLPVTVYLYPMQMTRHTGNTRMYRLHSQHFAYFECAHTPCGSDLLA